MWWQSAAAGNARYYGIIALAAIVVFYMAACEGEREPPSTPSPSLTLPASATPSAQSSELPTATPAGLLPVPTLPSPAMFSSPEEAIADYYVRVRQEPYVGDCSQLAHGDKGERCSTFWAENEHYGWRAYLVVYPEDIYLECRIRTEWIVVEENREARWEISGVVGHPPFWAGQ